MKQETLDQITEFEKFLETNKAQNAELAAKASKQLEDEKRRILGIQKMKEMIEGQAADTLRTKLQDLKFYYTQKKAISQVEYHQQAMAYLLQLEKCANTTLTEHELAFKNSIQNKGTEQIKSTEISEKVGDKLANYG